MSKKILLMIFVMCIILTSFTGAALAKLDDKTLLDYAKKNKITVDYFEDTDVYGETHKKPFLVIAKGRLQYYGILGQSKAGYLIYSFCQDGNLHTLMEVNFPSEKYCLPKYVNIVQNDDRVAELPIVGQYSWRQVKNFEFRWLSYTANTAELSTADTYALKNVAAISITVSPDYSYSPTIENECYIPLIKKDNKEHLNKIQKSMEHIYALKNMEDDNHVYPYITPEWNP